MKKAFRFVSFILVGILFYGGLGIIIPDQFANSYQRAIVTQYEYCKSIKNNKIVFVGASSLSFGLNLDTMEQLTNMPCAIIGNHAGTGLVYSLEMAKSTLKSGDIVVVEALNVSADGIGRDLLSTGLGNRIDLYRFVHPHLLGSVLSAYPIYVFKNLANLLLGSEPVNSAFSMDSYDNRGNMVYERNKCLIPEPFTEKIAAQYGYATFEPIRMETDYLEYLREYVDYCTKNDISVYFVAVPAFDEALQSTTEDMVAYDACLRNQLPAPYISNQSDYIFSREYMYDGILHCNTEGAKYRTECIYRDLQPYLNGKS